MSALPAIPENAPFDAMQRAWLNGFIAGLFHSAGSPAPAAAPAESLGPLLFLYGSQTGTAENLASKFAKDARARGFEARAVGMESFATIDFARESRVAVITSTYGEGEMPDNAQPFWEFLRKDPAPRLDHLSFSVLALGDTNYAQFCQAGKAFDALFEALGAKRLHPRADCDVDYDAPAKDWFDGLLNTLAPTGEAPKDILSPGDVAPSGESFSKSNPFPATLKTNRLLNAPGSAKEVRHFEIDLAGSGLEYDVGDALGILPANCPDFVSEILAAAGLNGEEAVAVGDGEMPLRSSLTGHFDLRSFHETLPNAGVTAAELASGLRKLQPRLYSISSSPKAHPGEVHLTVGIVRYELDGQARKGVCSTFLADRATGDAKVPVFVHRSPGFRLPADGLTPVIMVGPGTGIAPFRAFLEERRAVGAKGKNWLFFGDQRAATDFLYREELEAFQSDGLLTRLDTAFSRDQAEKSYVQHRMMENAADLWAWLQDGATFYVCGDASRMARDVDAALHQVAETAGVLSPEAAQELVKQMKAEKRYLRDVY